ncbi:MAG: hypothetical protein ACXVAY_18985 [Mucilaginibacter sp.]
MKRYLFTLSLFFCVIAASGQSIGLIDLTNLTVLNGDQANDYFVAAKTFKLQYGEEVNGFLVKHYQTNSKTFKSETVLTGAGYKTANGSKLYTVSYVTNYPQNVLNLIGQAVKAGLKLSFQGVDQVNNIYIYDNFLYHVVMKISLNQNSGVIDITQKEVFVQ